MSCDSNLVVPIGPSASLIFPHTMGNIEGTRDEHSVVLAQSFSIRGLHCLRGVLSKLMAGEWLYTVTELAIFSQVVGFKNNSVIRATSEIRHYTSRRVRPSGDTGPHGRARILCVDQ